ncbi:MAG: DUF1559 family PulG-like putative transporter [Pirellulaceae bacterium]
MSVTELQSTTPSECRRYPRIRPVLGILALLIVFGLGTWLFRAIRDLRDTAIAMGAECHLNQLQLALHNYHDSQGCFPPAYLVDNDGTPIHSWRVLILPFIEENELYEAYRFDEPWNGPNNLKLAEQMPQIFHMPNDPFPTTTTNIVAVVGPETAFPGSGCTQRDDFTDGLDNTILVAEITSSGICWLEPRDLHVEDMSFSVNDPKTPSISSSRRRGPYVVFADSIHTYRLSPSLDPEALKAVTTRSGGEQMCLGDIDEVGLVNLAHGPVTDATIQQMSYDSVRSLWLSRSEITDRSLAHLAAASSLSKLHLRSTHITDDGLRHFLLGPPLIFLDLCDTQIGDDGLRHLARTAELQCPGITIDLRGSRVTVAGVAQFLKSMRQPKFPMRVWLLINDGSVSHEVISLSNSLVTDTQIEHFRGLSGVHQINLSQTQITDAALKVISGFSALQHLDVSGTQITDSGLELLTGLTALGSLHIDNTRVTDEAVKRLQKVLPTCTIQH